MGQLTAQYFFIFSWVTLQTGNDFETLAWMLKNFFCDVRCRQHRPLVEFLSDLRRFSELCKRVCWLCCRRGLETSDRVPNPAREAILACRTVPISRKCIL